MSGVTQSILMFSYYFALPTYFVVMILRSIYFRIRNDRSPHPDPHLGRKIACYWILNLAVIVLLCGMTLSAVDMLSTIVTPSTAGTPAPTLSFNNEQRTALGLILSGMLYTILMIVVLRLFTNDRHFPAIRKAMLGQGFVSTGLVHMYATICAICLSLQMSTDMKELVGIASVGVIWGGMATICLVLLLRMRGDVRTPESDSELHDERSEPVGIA